MSLLHIVTHGSGIPVIFVHGSFGWGVQAFPKQIPLKKRHRLLFLDRRGFGQSLDAVPRVDFDVDACDIVQIVEELGEPAHLVGHSYGAVPCLLSAQSRPDLIRSIALVEPSAFSVVRGNSGVEEFINRLYAAVENAANTSPREFLRNFVAAMGYEKPDLPEPDAMMARSIVASATERRPWEAHLDLQLLRRYKIPTLIVSGSWAGAPPEARRIAGAAFHAAAEQMERELQAWRIIVPTAAHNPQMIAAPLNSQLEIFWTLSEAHA